VCTCELSVLGVLSIDDSFFNDVGISKFDNSFLAELSMTVINLSFDIYNQRHILYYRLAVEFLVYPTVFCINLKNSMIII
jgi:hypothetical protein